MKPGWDGDVELHEGRYWSVSLFTGVGGSGVGGVGMVWMVLMVWVVAGVLAVLLAMVVATMVEMLVEVSFCGWYLSQVVGVLWWWCWRVLGLCCGVAGG